MNQLYLSLGSNQGVLSSNLKLAAASISFSIGKIKTRSSVYKTAAWGVENQADYYNQVVEVETDLSPQDVLQKCLDIEDKMGRVRQTNWGPRVIDIDVLFYGDQVIEESNLLIPHPHLQNRNFVLVPFCEIAGDWQHPVFQKSMKELLESCEDKLEVFQLEYSE